MNVRECRAVLSRTPAALDALLRGLTEAWTGARDGEHGWSPFDVLGHLVHGEQDDWMVRLRIILSDGEGDGQGHGQGHGARREFAPFDRLAQFRDSRGKSLEDLLDQFAALRVENLAELEQIEFTPERLARTGVHPAFGQVSLEQLISTWVVHDLSHIAQISRFMARRYREQVGPWIEYLPILTRG